MEAKDTELTQKQIDKVDEQGVIDGDIVPYLKAQAEISFKAGIREVVEWLQSREYAGDFFAVMAQREVDWQAKLKEWG